MISKRLGGRLIMALVLVAIVSLSANLWWFRDEARWRPLSPVCWPDGREAHYLVGDVSDRFRKTIMKEAQFIRFRVMVEPGNPKRRVQMQESVRTDSKKSLLGGELIGKSAQIAAAEEKAAGGKGEAPTAGNTCAYVATWTIQPVGKPKRMACIKGTCTVLGILE